MTLLRLSAAALLTCAVLAPLTRAASGDDKEKKPYDLRLFCPTFVVRPKYVANPRGGLTYVPPAAGDIPPPMFYIKRGPKDEIAIPLQTGVFGQRVIIDPRSVVGGEIELLAGSLQMGVEIPAEKGKPGPATTGFGETRFPVAKLKLEAGRPLLVCFYQPDLKAKWMPPRQLVADIGPEAFPAGAVMVMNLTARPMVAAVGPMKAPASVAPGTMTVLPGNVAEALPVKVALQNKTGYDVLLNSTRNLPEARRAVLVVTTSDPAFSAGQSASVEWKLFDEIKTASDSPKKPGN